MMHKNKYLVVIAGPTGIGKTQIAIAVAQKLKTEIISADARQFYRELNTGVAKPDAGELKTVKHHFINSLSVFDKYDVAKYEHDVLQTLHSLFLKYNAVIITGGSGLFIDAVTNGLDALPPTDGEIRTMLQQKLYTEGIESLRKLLKEKDEKYFSEGDMNNPRRIMRALEVFLSTGIPYSSFRKKHPVKRNFTPVKICLHTGRQILYEQINKRVDVMMRNGLLDEVKMLYAYKNLNALNTVGYKELFDYMDNKIKLDEAVALIKKNTRNYAKRQLTWFRKDKEYVWTEPHSNAVIQLMPHELIL